MSEKPLLPRARWPYRGCVELQRQAGPDLISCHGAQVRPGLCVVDTPSAVFIIHRATGLALLPRTPEGQYRATLRISPLVLALALDRELRLRDLDHVDWIERPRLSKDEQARVFAAIEAALVIAEEEKLSLSGDDVTAALLRALAIAGVAAQVEPIGRRRFACMLTSAEHTPADLAKAIEFESPAWRVTFGGRSMILGPSQAHAKAEGWPIAALAKMCLAIGQSFRREQGELEAEEPREPAWSEPSYRALVGFCGARLVTAEAEPGEPLRLPLTKRELSAADRSGGEPPLAEVEAARGRFEERGAVWRKRCAEEALAPLAKEIEELARAARLWHRAARTLFGVPGEALAAAREGNCDQLRAHLEERKAEISCCVPETAQATIRTELERLSALESRVIGRLEKMIETIEK